MPILVLYSYGMMIYANLPTGRYNRRSQSRPFNRINSHPPPLFQNPIEQAQYSVDFCSSSLHFYRSHESINHFSTNLLFSRYYRPVTYKYLYFFIASAYTYRYPTSLCCIVGRPILELFTYITSARFISTRRYTSISSVPPSYTISRYNLVIRRFPRTYKIKRSTFTARSYRFSSYVRHILKYYNRKITVGGGGGRGRGYQRVWMQLCSHATKKEKAIGADMALGEGHRDNL